MQNLATTFITEEEYLAAEETSPEKHEYLNGLIYPLHHDPITNMAGASDAHVKITGNAYYHLRTHLRGSNCFSYTSDMRLNVDALDKGWFYPDVLVTCDEDDKQRNTFKKSPTLIIEVLSPSTRDYDKGRKFDAYRLIPSLQEYALVDPQRYFVEVFRLNEHKRWELYQYQGENSIVVFTSLDFSCSMVELYEDVIFSNT